MTNQELRILEALPSLVGHGISGEEAIRLIQAIWQEVYNRMVGE